VAVSKVASAPFSTAKILFFSFFQRGCFATPLKKREKLILFGAGLVRKSFKQPPIIFFLTKG
jgi:hypothetical protein